MNKRILLALLTSFIGNHFYILFVSLVLLKIGYSASFTSFAIGVTIIPNLLFGPQLGKLVDRSDKVKLHTLLCLSLAAIVNILSFTVFNLSVEQARPFIVILMVIYNCFSSPLNTLLYQYIVPSLDKNESKAFIVWERYEAAGIFLASIIGYLFIQLDFIKLLLPLDALTYLVCAFVIHSIWQTPAELHESEDISKPKRRFRIQDLLVQSPQYHVLLFAVLSVLIFVFVVDSHTYNIGVLFFKQHNLPDQIIPLIMSIVSLFNIFGSFYFEKRLLNLCNSKIHTKSLVAISFSLLILGIGIKTNLSLLSFFALASLQVIEPIWSTTSNVLLRSQVKSNRLGEFFGFFRILRSLFTFGGIVLYGQFQESNMLANFVYISAFLTLIPICINIFSFKSFIKQYTTKGALS